MASSKSMWSGGQVRGTRRFNLAEAHRALPLVSRVVADIVRTHEQAVLIQTKLEEGSIYGKDRAVSQDRIEQLMDKLQEYVDELADIGVELKDYSSGLIDFVGRHEGRDVYLCWKLGEEKIGFWHELNSGFAGRRPVSELHED